MGLGDGVKYAFVEKNTFMHLVEHTQRRERTRSCPPVLTKRLGELCMSECCSGDDGVSDSTTDDVCQSPRSSDTSDSEWCSIAAGSPRSSQQPSDWGENVCAVMIKNIPCRCTRAEL